MLQRPQSYKNRQANGIWKFLGQVRTKKLFPGTITCKVFGTNSIFYVKKGTTGKVHFLFLRIGWSTRNSSMKFWDFPDFANFLRS